MALTNLVWNEPTMQSNALVINLSDYPNQDKWVFSPTQDVIFIGASTPRTTDRLYTVGGHNIEVIGGDYAPVTTDPDATMHFQDATGEIYVEGVHIDNSNSGEKDAIGAGSTNGSAPNLVIQNSLIEGVTGNFTKVHGDGVQNYGALGNVEMYNVTIHTDYQGIFMDPGPGTPVGSLTLDNVNVVRETPAGADPQTWLYYFLSPKTETPYPIHFDNVYVPELPGLPAETSSVYPPHEVIDGVVRTGNQLTWPLLPYTGAMTVGEPAGGDFVTASEVGIGYQHQTTIVSSPTLPGSGSTTTGTTTGTTTTGTTTGTTGTGTTTGTGSTTTGTTTKFNMVLDDTVSVHGSNPHVMTGSSSPDLFVLHASAANGDVITNFNASQGDQLLLKGFGSSPMLTHTPLTDNWTVTYKDDAGHVLQDTVHMWNVHALSNGVNYHFG